MAFNLQTFKTRTLTAMVFVAIMLAGLLINQWTFFILFSVIHFGCWIEYQKLVGKMDADYAAISPFHKYGIMIAGYCFMLFFTDNSYHLFGLSLHELGWWLGLIFIFILPVVEILFAQQVYLKNIGYSFAGLVYISLSWGLLMAIHADDLVYTAAMGWNDNGLWIPLLIIISIWINDTMAYIVGSLIGKTPLSAISPKKTWEGTIGGMILSVAVMGTAAYFIDRFRPEILNVVAIAFIAALAGTFGDLLESKLKRSAGVKDSGNLMPGHGGFLDRFDSLLLAIPFVWIYVNLFML